MKAPPSARVLTTLNLKGGVGKTHTTWLAAAVAQERELRTLLVDMDTQGNLTSTFLTAETAVPGVELLFNPAVDGDVHSLIRRHLTVDVLGFSGTLATKHLKHKLTACMAELLDRQLIVLPAASTRPADLFVKRAKGSTRSNCTVAPHSQNPVPLPSR